MILQSKFMEGIIIENSNLVLHFTYGASIVLVKRKSDIWEDALLNYETNTYPIKTPVNFVKRTGLRLRQIYVN